VVRRGDEVTGDDHAIDDGVLERSLQPWCAVPETVSLNMEAQTT